MRTRHVRRSLADESCASCNPKGRGATIDGGSTGYAATHQPDRRLPHGSGSFLGWIDDKKSRPGRLMADAVPGEPKLDPPPTPGFLAGSGPTAGVITYMGIVRRKKCDVASDIPARTAKWPTLPPVELDDEFGAQNESVPKRSGAGSPASSTRYRGVGSPARDVGAVSASIESLVRLVTRTPSSRSRRVASNGDNVFTMVRRDAGTPPSAGARWADLQTRPSWAQNSSARSCSSPRHIDVMDAAEQDLRTSVGMRSVSLRRRLEPRRPARRRDRRVLTNDSEVSVIVCSLSAAGVRQIQPAGGVERRAKSAELFFVFFLCFSFFFCRVGFFYTWTSSRARPRRSIAVHRIGARAARDRRDASNSPTQTIDPARSPNISSTANGGPRVPAGPRSTGSDVENPAGGWARVAGSGAQPRCSPGLEQEPLAPRGEALVA